MKYVSTRDPNRRVSLEAAVTRGLAPDGGLYLPETIPRLPESLLGSLPGRTLPELAAAMIHDYLAADFSRSEIESLISASMTFDAPLVRVADRVAALELFHGPTLAFKDFAARFMARLLESFASREGDRYTVLVATSGDTGSAVASGFHDCPGIDVVILYPSGRVSPAQEKQLTTLGGNVQALEVEGSFDDCQALVKACFGDSELTGRVRLTSANSINIARLLPQTFYYARLVAQADRKLPLVVAVPCGNFGNLAAGLIAKQMGLPLGRFVAATNENDVVPKFLETGEYAPRSSVATLSSAMDVGNPSNWERIRVLHQEDPEAIRSAMVGARFSDSETLEAIRSVYHECGYLLDPHGAVGYLGLEQALLSEPDSQGVFLACAHPAKFAEVVARATGVEPLLPPALTELLDRTKQAICIRADYDELKSFLLS